MNQAVTPSNSASKKEDSRESGLIWLTLGLLFFGTAWQFQTLSPQALVKSVKNNLDISGKWTVCLIRGGANLGSHTLADLGKQLSDCAQVSVPKDLPRSLQPSPKDLLVYKTQFTSPAFCGRVSPECMLVSGEIGDSAEVILNGSRIAEHGRLPPHPRYAKNYPLSAFIPESALRPLGELNDLAIIVYSLKHVQSGIRKTPIAIVPSDTGFAVARNISLQRVVLPMLMGSGVLLIALVSLMSLLVYRVRNKKLWALLAYCVASGSFLVSFTEIPREYIPIGLAGCIHYFLRYAMDLTLVELVAEHFRFHAGLRKIARPVYLAFLALFILQWACEPWIQSGWALSWIGFDGAYHLAQMGTPLVLFPLFYGLVSSWRLRHTRGISFFVLFICATLIQLNDRLVFLQITEQVYLLKFLPLPFALAFAIQLWLEHFKELERGRRAAELGKVAAQLAHDIRAPLVTARTVIQKLSNIPGQDLRILNTAHSRMEHIANDLLDFHVASSQRPSIPHCFVRAAIDSAVAEKTAMLENPENIEIRSSISPNVGIAGVAIADSEFSRMLSNLIYNSIEAVREKQSAVISVEAERVGDRIKITISDNGVGMSEDVLQRVQTIGGSYGKAKGTGMGLSYAKAVVATALGRLSVASTLGKGTAVTLELPLSTMPQWCAEALTIGADETVVVLDDDESVHLFWQKRLSGRKLHHIRDPRDFDVSMFPKKSCRYIFDYQISGSQLTGLDLIVRYGLGNRAVLATSHFNDAQIQLEILKTGSSILPKFMMSEIEIREGDNSSADDDGFADLVLIDNDLMIHDSWKMQAAEQDKKIKTYFSVDDFLSNSSQHSPQTPIYVDSDLGEADPGEVLSKKIADRGFERILLATGKGRADSTQFPWLSGVVDKGFPLGSR